MAVEVRFMSVIDDDCVLLKYTGNVLKTYSDVQFTDTSSIIDPVLILSDFPEGANYCYIPKFNRYYFVRDIVVGPAGKYYVTCHVDVLESNALEILGCYGYVNRGGRPVDWETYLPDNLRPIKTTTRAKNIPFSSTPFEIVSAGAPLGKATFNYILTVVGGEHNDN